MEGESEASSVGDGTGSEASLKLAERKKDNMKKSKQKEPTISQIDIDEEGKLTIESVNIKKVTVKYYMIDAEILFSRAPFLKNNAEEFSYVKPYYTHVEQMVPENADIEQLTTYVI